MGRHILIADLSPLLWLALRHGSVTIRIGLKRAWFQNHHNCPHYDLTSGKRRLAVFLGAIEITNAELIKRIRMFRGKK